MLRLGTVIVRFENVWEGFGKVWYALLRFGKVLNAFGKVLVSFSKFCKVLVGMVRFDEIW